MFKEQYSQTQLANVSAIAGILALLSYKVGIVGVTQDQIAFVIVAVWTLGWQAYNFYQRFKQGDITLGGFRKS
jgi:hypothetical protein